MSRVFGVAPSAFLAALLLVPLGLATGCEREAPPELLGLTDVVPREVEIGDRVELTGSGFPQGRVAEVRFHGTLKRPGEAPDDGVELHAQGAVTSAQSVEIHYDDPLEARFCQSGERRVHTTFVGDVEIAFPAAAAGAPPLTATLHGVHLDLRPPRRAGGDDEREGERALLFLGIHVEPRPSLGGGLVVSAIDQGSRAEESDLRVGDILTSLEDLRIGELADVVPPPRLAQAHFGVRRPGASEEQTVTLRLEGFRPAASESLLPGAALLVGVLALLLLFALPPGPRRAFMEARLAEARASLGLAWPRAPRDRRLYQLVVVAIGGSAAVLPLARVHAMAELDLVTIGGPAATALAVVALLASSHGARGVLERLGARLGALAQALLLDLVVALSLASAVVAGGSLRLHDLVYAQGPMPWEWNAFHTPALLVAVTCAVVALAAQRAPRPRHDLAEAESPPAHDAASGPFALADWAHLGVGSVLLAVAFFGGFRVYPMGGADGRFGREIAGALVLVAKSGCVAWAVLKIRAALPVASRRALLGVSARRLVPLSALALLATHVIVARALPHRVELLVSGVTLAWVVAAFLYLARRSQTSESRLAVDPFL